MKKTDPTDALAFQASIRSLGAFDHISVVQARGNLVIHNYGEPTARASTVGSNLWRLDFLNNAGKWESMPFVGNLDAIASNVVDCLGPFLAKIE